VENSYLNTPITNVKNVGNGTLAVKGYID